MVGGSPGAEGAGEVSTLVDIVFCRACGAQVRIDAPFCPRCGASQNQVPFVINPDRGFIGSVKTCFRKYANFTGRAPRSEYWRWILFSIIVGVVIGVVANIIDAITNNQMPGTISIVLLFFAVLLPSLSVTVRRLHDHDKSGWWLLALYIAPVILRVIGSFAILLGGPRAQAVQTGLGLVGVLIGISWLALAIVMFVWFCTRGTNGANRFGQNPLPANF